MCYPGTYFEGKKKNTRPCSRFGWFRSRDVIRDLPFMKLHCYCRSRGLASYHLYFFSKDIPKRFIYSNWSWKLIINKIHWVGDLKAAS
jgi:hypothetical protein